MTNHTPWKNIDNVITDSEGFEIAIVYGEVNGKQEQEIAQLIAAAPELLEALKAVLDEYGCQYEEGHVPAVDRALSAIAKAKGRA